jgi:MFS family permease
VIGPVLGGALVAISWHWVFWFNVPFGLAGSAVGVRSSCTRSRAARASRSLRLPGTITFLIGLTGLVYGISKGGISGWGSPLVIGGADRAAVLLPLFV